MSLSTESSCDTIERKICVDLDGVPWPWRTLRRKDHPLSQCAAASASSAARPGGDVAKLEDAKVPATLSEKLHLGEKEVVDGWLKLFASSRPQPLYIPEKRSAELSLV